LDIKTIKGVMNYSGFFNRDHVYNCILKVLHPPENRGEHGHPSSISGETGRHNIGAENTHMIDYNNIDGQNDRVSVRSHRSIISNRSSVKLKNKLNESPDSKSV
jgi:hypothetical protein